MSYNNYMKDCVHLKACRRMAKKAKIEGHPFTRGCNEACTAYVPGDEGEYVTVETAVRYARSGASSIRSGYDAYDVYCTQDLCAKTLNQIIYDVEYEVEE